MTYEGVSREALIELLEQIEDKMKTINTEVSEILDLIAAYKEGE